MSDPKSTACEYDLFPEGLFANLTPEEQGNVKDLILGNRLEEEDIDLAVSGD